MKDKDKSISTQDLWVKLFDAPTIDYYFTGAGSEIDLPDFADYIGDLAALRKEKHETIIRRANLESSFGHRIFAGTRNPSRDTVLLLAFGFELTTDETQLLLKVARATPLHPKVRRDAIIAYCLHNGRSLIETQELLHDAGQPLLGMSRFK